MEVVRDKHGQLHHRLLDREPRPDGRAHRRLDHRGAGADADRQGIPDACATPRSRSCARSASTPAAPTCSSPINPDDGRMVVIEMNPRVSRSSALASKATGFPIAKIAAKLAVGYTLDELRTTSPAAPRRPPSSRRSTTSSPRSRASPSRNSRRPTTRLTTQMKSVGEVMAIGRTFQESLQKALRGLETGVDGLDRADRASREEIVAGRAAATPGAERIWYVGDAFRSGMTLRRDLRADQDRSRGSWRRSRRSSRSRASCDGRDARRASTPTSCARSKQQGLLRPPPRPSCWASTEHAVRERRHALGVRPVYKRVDTCAAEFATYTAYMYSTYEEECEAQPTDRQEDHGAGRRAEPHRPGHRVRLLLRARRARAARGRLRDHHGQLQPGDRLDRLRHLRPPLLRAADAGRRARDRRT